MPSLFLFFDVLPTRHQLRGGCRERALAHYATALSRTHLIVRCVRLLVYRQEGDALDAGSTRLLEHYPVVCFLRRNHGREPFRRGHDGSEALLGGSESTRTNAQAPEKTTREHASKFVQLPRLVLLR